MNIKRRYRLLTRGKSPSKEAMRRTYTRAIQQGGVTQDFSANVENIRELSRKVGYNVLQDANFLYVPSSYGEGKNFVQNPSLRNLVKFSEEFDNGIWSKSSVTITSNAVIAPNGTMTSDKLIASVSNSTHLIDQINTSTSNKTYSIYVKAAEYSNVRLNCGTSANGYISVNLLNGTINSSSGTYLISSDIIDVGNGWYRINIVISNGSPTNVFTVAIENTPNNTLFLGDGTSGIYVWGAQLEQSPIATTYQRTTDAISDFTFTRATSATVTNKQGVIEDSCYNLLQRSEEFDNAIWDKLSSGVGSVPTVTANYSISPIGTITADRVQFNLNGGTSISDYSLIERGGITSSEKNASIYIKTNDGTTKTIFFRILGAGDLQLKTIDGNWTRIEKSGQCDYFQFGLRGSIGTSNSVDLSVWGAQLEQSSTPRPYLRTTNRLNVPRLDYSRSLLEPSLLIEPQRTNLVIQSENPGASPWIGVGVGAADVVLTSNLNPFGVNRSYTIKDGVSGGIAHAAIQTVNVVSGTTYTASLYVKKATTDWFQFAFATNGFSDTWLNFNFTTGQFGNSGNGGTYTKTQLPNGWWKLTMTSTAIATINPGIDIIGTNNTNSAIFPAYTGTNQVFCDFAAMQFEQGSNATTYIPTTTATVTRNAELNYVDLSNNNVLNQNNFTLYVEGHLYHGTPTSANVSVVLSDTTGDGAQFNDIGWYRGVRPTYTVAGAASTLISDLPNNSYYRFIIQRDGTTVKFFRIGAQIWTTQTVPVFNYKYLVMNNGGSTYTVDKIALFNRTLTDLECTNLTTP